MSGNIIIIIIISSSSIIILYYAYIILRVLYESTHTCLLLYEAYFYISVRNSQRAANQITSQEVEELPRFSSKMVISEVILHATVSDLKPHLDIFILSLYHFVDIKSDC